jgi:DNA-binding transcriptional regulator YhcF (GntR family)
MLVRINPRDSAPLYAQIAAGIRRTIANGEIEPGEQLPTARDLAASLDVNLHTVLRAYQILRDENLVEIRRGRGVSVVRKARAQAELVRLARPLLEAARRYGVGLEELKLLLEELA